MEFGRSGEYLVHSTRDREPSQLHGRGVWGVKENRRFSTSETLAFGGQCPHWGVEALRAST